MAKNLTTSLTGFKERQCTMAIVLDIRSNRKDMTEYPVKARFTIDRKSYYYPVGGSYTKEEFSEICNVQKSKSPKYDEKKRLLQLIDKYKKMLVALTPGHALTLDAVRMVVEGRTMDMTAKQSFVGIWENKIHRLRTENNGRQYSTSLPYEAALNSFKKFLWDENIEGFNISIEHLKKWEHGMIYGAKGPNGEELKPVSATYRGINLRHCRAIWNECRKLGYLTQVEYPFSNVKDGCISIPAPASRKMEYLNIEQFTQLFMVFKNKNYPNTWKAGYAERAHYSLGLFLALYLGNGFNLIDAAKLTYSKFYFDSGRRAFKFYRTKTKDRNLNGSEVIIPITEPLQYILDEIAAPPVLDGYVFPDILNGTEDVKEIRKLTSQCNSNIHDRMKKICKEVLGWEVVPSTTWTRHSYATNLTQEGVEERFVQESMGHAHQQSVTDTYIAKYSVDKHMECNNKLLKTNKEEEIDIDNMTPEQMKTKLKELLNK